LFFQFFRALASYYTNYWTSENTFYLAYKRSGIGWITYNLLSEEAFLPIYVKNFLRKNMKQSTNTFKKDEEKAEFKHEKETGSKWLERASFRIALTSIFISLSIVLGYMLIFIPNIEVITVMIFLSGFILGKKEGLIVGAFSSFIFCFFNPMGSSQLPLLVVQIVYYSLVGLIGAFTSDFIEKRSFFNSKDDLYVYQVLVIFGVIGGVLTTIYSIFSEIAGFITISAPGVPFSAYFLMGVPWTIVHIVGNVLGFVFILPGLIQIINTLLD